LLSLLLNYTSSLSFSTIYQLFTSSSTLIINKNNSLKSNIKNMINKTNDDSIDNIDSSFPLSIDRSYLHTTEYPDDDYNHIFGYHNNQHELSTLQLISKLRIQDTIRNKKPIDTDGCGIDPSMYISQDDLLDEIMDFDSKYGRPINLYKKLKSASSKMSLAAEFKRASPSKGDINVHVDVVEQTLMYAEMGASVISILTEFEHFKGTLNDLKKVRLAINNRYQYDLSDRPAILRKDFIFDRYQILEARTSGADTVLLMVSVLGVHQLQDLIIFSRNMGMEPLVEVTTVKEMEIALDCGAIVIGVNNRNLHNFQLDMNTTERVIEVLIKRNMKWRKIIDDNNNDDHDDHDSRSYDDNNDNDDNVHDNSNSSNDHERNDNNNNKMKKLNKYKFQTATQIANIARSTNDICLAALSGISSYEDVIKLQSLGVTCCLVGETLMKSSDPASIIKSLLGKDNTDNSYNNVDNYNNSSDSSSNNNNNNNNNNNDKSSKSTYISMSMNGPLIKTCGMVNVDDVKVALSNGVNLIGIIFAEGSKRCITDSNIAIGVVNAVRSYGERQSCVTELSEELENYKKLSLSTSQWFQKTGQLISKVTTRTPLVVGVFQDQSIQYINTMIDLVGLDLIQLHGNESPEYIDQIAVPCIKVIHIPSINNNDDSNGDDRMNVDDRNGDDRMNVDDRNGDDSLKSQAKLYSNRAIALLLDSQRTGTKGGGTGKVFDWSVVDTLDGIPVLLAGGLNASNVKQALYLKNIIGVDVSSELKLIIMINLS